MKAYLCKTPAQIQDINTAPAQIQDIDATLTQLKDIGTM